MKTNLTNKGPVKHISFTKFTEPEVRSGVCRNRKLRITGLIGTDPLYYYSENETMNNNQITLKHITDIKLTIPSKLSDSLHFIIY